MKKANYIAKVSKRNALYLLQANEFAKSYRIIGVIDVGGLPAPQFQRIRASINKTAKILIIKKNIIEIALNGLEKNFPGISKLVESANGVVGLIFTNDNPFTLYKFVKKNKSTAPAKAGSIAPKEIVVPAGPTSFAPGPIIGELGALKIKAGIANGKVEIKSDSPVAQEGDVISEALAGVLSRLGIEPMEVGLNIKAIYEGGTIYNREILDVDEDAILASLKGEAIDCFKLAIGLNFPTSENINYFITNSARESLALGIGLAYPAAETLANLFSKANAQACGVGNSIPAELRPADLVASSATSSVASGTPVANEESSKEEKKIETPVDAGAGFGSLF